MENIFTIYWGLENEIVIEDSWWFRHQLHMLNSFLSWDTYKTDLIASLPYKGGLFFEHRRIPATQVIQSTLIASRLLTMVPCLRWADSITI